MIDLVPLQVSVRASTVLDAAADLGGLAVVAAAVAGGLAVVYRWYARERVSNPPAVLVALATVALLLNAMTALGDVMYGATTLSVRAAAFNVSALAAGIVAALVGTTVGDHLARTVLGGTDQAALDGSVSRVVRAVGRVITVSLPDEIEDVPGYDPVDADTKATLEGKTFVFPRGLTVQELRDRLSRRLREDYRVGHVDIEIDDDGTVTHLGLGARAAGIGPTLPPESAAMAVRADPAYAASAGDLVQVWERTPQRRLLNAEVRGTAGAVVTLAIDAADASKLSSEERYKLVTLPVEERDDRELTELLRAADETLGVVEIAEGSALAGVPIGALDVTVVAIHAGGPDDHIEALPAGDRVVSGGDSVYVIARPDAIRRIEAAGTAESVGEHATSTIPDVGESTAVEPSSSAGGSDEETDRTPAEANRSVEESAATENQRPDDSTSVDETPIEGDDEPADEPTDRDRGSDNGDDPSTGESAAPGAENDGDGDEDREAGPGDPAEPVPDENGDEDDRE